MSETIQCQDCGGQFDIQVKTPMILPCSHQMCFECVQRQYQQTQQIQCSLTNCCQVTKKYPAQLQSDESLLKNIKQNLIAKNIQILQAHENDISVELINLKNAKIYLVNKIIQDLENYQMANISFIQNKLKNLLYENKQEKNNQQESQNKLNTGDRNVDIQDAELNQLNEKTQFEIQKAQTEINNLLKKNVFEENINLRVRNQKSQKTIEQQQFCIKQLVSQIQQIQNQLISSQQKYLQLRDQLEEYQSYILKESINIMLINQITQNVVEFLQFKSEKFQQHLLKIVNISKNQPKIQQAAANALTMLNYMNFAFTDIDFSNLDLSKSDLSDTTFTSCNFANSNLTQANLRNSKFINCDFTRSNLNSIITEHPYIFTGHTKSVYAVAISRDSEFIVSGSGDKTVRLWDVKTGTSKTMSGHTSCVTAVAISSDSEFIVSGSFQTIMLWDVKSGNSQTISGSTN